MPCDPSDAWTTKRRVAFVFYDRDFPAASVPPWAIKVVLDPDELGAGEDEAQGGVR